MPGRSNRGLGACGLEEARELANRGVAPDQRPSGPPPALRRPRSGPRRGAPRGAPTTLPSPLRSAPPREPGLGLESRSPCRPAGCRRGRHRRRGSSPPYVEELVEGLACPDSRARRRPRSSPGGCGCAGDSVSASRDRPCLPVAAARSARLRVWRNARVRCSGPAPYPYWEI